MKESLTVPEDLAGMPLDEFLALRWPRVAKGSLRRLIRDGCVEVDGMPAVKPQHKLREGQHVALDAGGEELHEVRSPALDVDVIYQDEHLLAVDKPAGFPVEPSRWGEHPVHLTGALLDWAEDRRRPDGLPVARPRALHRLDLGTSGVLLYALSLEGERYYRNLFEARRVGKTYHALVLGEVREAGVVDRAIGPDRRRGGLMRVSRDGKPALTEYAPLRRFRGYTLLEVRPRTGRTHQIRVHLASIGHPLIVDPRYGGRDKIFLSEFKPGYRHKAGRPEKPLMDRLTLHAHSLEFTDLGGSQRRIVAPHPKDLRVLLGKMEKWRRAPEEKTK